MRKFYLSRFICVLFFLSLSFGLQIFGDDGKNHPKDFSKEGWTFVDGGTFQDDLSGETAFALGHFLFDLLFGSTKEFSQSQRSASVLGTSSAFSARFVMQELSSEELFFARQELYQRANDPYEDAEELNEFARSIGLYHFFVIEPLDTVRRFCQDSGIDLLWDTLVDQVASSDKLDEMIYNSYRLRKKYIRPLERLRGKGYIDKKITSVRAAAKEELLLLDKIKRERLEKELAPLETFHKNSSKKTEGHRTKQRKKAFDHTIESLNKQSTRLYRVNLFELDGQHSYLIARLKKCVGNNIEQNIHAEIVDTIKKIASPAVVGFNPNYFIKESYGRCIQSTKSIIMRAADIALDYKDEKKYVRAYSFSDFCSSLLTVVGQGVGSGVSNFSSSCRALLDCFINDPGATVRGVAYGAKEGVKKALMLFLKSCAAMDHRDLESSAFVSGPTIDCREFRGTICDKLLFGFDSFAKNPEQSSIDAIAWATEALLHLGLWDIGITKATAFADLFSQVMRNELAVVAVKVRRQVDLIHDSASVTHPYAIDIEVVSVSDCPITTVVKDSCEVVRFAQKEIERGVAKPLAIQSAVQTGKFGPPEYAHDLLQEHVALIEESECLSTKRVSHVCFGEFKGVDERRRLVSGLHSWQGVELYKQATGKTAGSFKVLHKFENGVRVMTIDGKKKTIFPESFTIADIVDVMKEAGTIVAQKFKSIAT